MTTSNKGIIIIVGADGNLGGTEYSLSNAMNIGLLKQI